MQILSGENFSLIEISMRSAIAANKDATNIEKEGRTVSIYTFLILGFGFIIINEK